MRTQVAIVGAGPAGLLLSQILQHAGISCVVLERRSRAYVEGRVRAGVLESVTVNMLERIGVADRMRREGLPHDGFNLGLDGRLLRIDMANLTGGHGVAIYGQTEMTKDLIHAALSRGTPLIFEAQNVTPHDMDSASPFVTYRAASGLLNASTAILSPVATAFTACVGEAIPQSLSKIFERVYPFVWLGILAEVPPCSDELIYSNHDHGFALASMRSKTRSRYYIQCSVGENIDDWPDERIWDELAVRLGEEIAARMIRGPSFEKGFAPLRSFVSETMRYGRLFLAGDSAHIVPPTGAKGLNLAASDVHFLSQALIAFYRNGSEESLDGYCDKALARVWMAERFSWWFTGITHRFPDSSGFDRKMQIAELNYIKRSAAAQISLAENYVGLPLE